MRQLLTFLIVTLLAVGSLSAQNTQRRGLKLAKKTEKTEIRTDTARSTIEKIRVYGYEKAQNSSVESMFVTNDTNDTIYTINITLTYTDIKDRQLNQVTETLNGAIPPGETRNFTIKTWDKQHLWYYRLTQGRTNDYASPFDVKVKVNWVGY